MQPAVVPRLAVSRITVLCHTKHEIVCVRAYIHTYTNCNMAITHGFPLAALRSDESACFSVYVH